MLEKQIEKKLAEEAEEAEAAAAAADQDSGEETEAP